MPQLVIVDAQGVEQTLELEGDTFVLGRDPGTNIPLDDKKVSRKHARIFARGGQFWIEDLGSANGVLIAGTPITGPRQLFAGTEIEIGPFHLTYFDDATEGAEAFSLVGTSDLVAGQTFGLPGGEASVGRVDGNVIVLNDTSVSRQHAILVVTPTSVVVEDLESRNGTFVNGVKVARRQLRHGDRVRFGNIELELLGGQRPGLAERFASADATSKLAWGMAIVAAVLLLTTVVVVMARRKRGAARADGATALEQAYEQEIVAKFSIAQADMQREAWEAAASGFQQVLDRDPLHVEARRGLSLADTNREHQNTLNNAQRAFQAGDANQTLHLLAGIPPSAHYGGAAASLAQSARAALAQRALAEAQTACRGQDFRRCHELAIQHLTYQADSAAGKALVAEAETAMRARNLPFTPWGQGP